MCHEVCSSTVTARSEMHDYAESPMQIDEARFACHRKYNQAQNLWGDTAISEFILVIPNFPVIETTLQELMVCGYLC